MASSVVPTAAQRLRKIANAALGKVTTTTGTTVSAAKKRDPAARFPVSPFETWTYEDAEAAVHTANDESELNATRALRDAQVAPIPDQLVYRDPRGSLAQLTINRAFFDGDHWQMGAGWIGPHAQVVDPDYATTMNELVAAFTSKNVIREVVKRHASGLIGKPPTWSFVPRRALAEGEQPSQAEATAMAEANRLVRAWWDARKVQSLLHDALCTLLFAARAPLRLYIPSGLLSEAQDDTGANTNVVQVSSVADALNLIWPDHPKPEYAAVAQDDATKMEAGVRIYSGTDDHNEDVDAIELVYLDTHGRTVVRILTEDTAAAAPQSAYDFDYGARLSMIEMRRDPLITPQVTQAQRALNLALSMLPRSVITGGFLERVLLNAQLPGHFEKDVTGASTRFIPSPLVVGAGTTNAFAGIELKDAMGNVSLTTPDVKWRDPVPVDAPIDAAAKHYLDILDEVSQLHVVLSGDAVVSGKSREQARAEYVNSLMDTRPEVDAALRFLLETPLAMAEALCGQTGVFTNLVRVSVSCRLDTGPLSPEERTANEASIGKTLSTETAMSRNHVDDIDAELGRMADDPLSRAVLAKAQGDALVQLTTAGLSVTVAAKMIGLSDDIAAAIVQDLASSQFSTTPPPAPTPQTPPTTPPAQAPNSATGAHAQVTGGAASAAGGSQ